MNPLTVERVLFDVDRHLKLLALTEYNLVLEGVKKSVPRFNVMAENIKPWNGRSFDTTDSSMYSSFLWILSNELMKLQLEEDPIFYKVDPLYYKYVYMLNKVLHNVDVPADVNMPEIFYWPHTNGIVITRRAKLSNYLCMYQGTTIGRVGNSYPSFSGPCIMYPYSSITGDVTVDRLSVINTHEVVNKNVRVFENKRKDLFSFHFNGDLFNE